MKNKHLFPIFLIVFGLICFSNHAMSQFINQDEPSVISVNIGPGIFYDNSQGIDFGAAVASHNIIGELDYINANGGKTLGGKVFEEELSLRLGYYKSTANYSYFSFTAGLASVTYKNMNTYFDTDKLEMIERCIGHVSYGSISVATQMQFGINKFIGLGFKGIANYNKNAFSCGAFGFIAFNIFGWNNPKKCFNA